MEFLRTLFQLNRDAILFIYGLAFFVLGLAIVLQSRRYSQLELARSLPWLAAFGFLHAFNEWGDLFIPLQRSYLSEPGLALLTVIQLLFLAGSFACLFEFGVMLLHPVGRVRTLHTLPALLLIGWVMLSFFLLLPLSPALPTWHRESNAIARYFICLPGGLLAAYGLRQQAMHRFSGLDAPDVLNMLRIAGWALVFYALLAGLIPPPVPFPPGNWLNADTFDAVIGAPPFIFRAVIGLVMAVAIIRALKIFDLETEHFIESMEQQQILANERDRIARELHDGVIQKVYTAGLLIDSAAKMTSGDSPLAIRLSKATGVLNDAIGDLAESG
ncbi:MAG: histidine kinase dimerization/phosphoacceptor domain-containing protein [Chloroflexi bacterium]|nr:histidine kinase dimerization/phosphoacceptor domain-containing protein [Chloroflexota bacterium]